MSRDDLEWIITWALFDKENYYLNLSSIEHLISNLSSTRICGVAQALSKKIEIFGPVELEFFCAPVYLSLVRGTQMFFNFVHFNWTICSHNQSSTYAGITQALLYLLILWKRSTRWLDTSIFLLVCFILSVEFYRTS